jgi:hypothetical protein
MVTMMAPGEVATVATSLRWEAMPVRLTTTLYDLITALQDEVGTNNDALVVGTMVRLLRSGRLTVSGRHAQAGG